MNSSLSSLVRRRFLKISVATGLLASGWPAAGREFVPPRPDALRGLWGDQGNGRFVNPILPADYSDIDVIRVDDVYFAISSTLHTSPGMALLQSQDLVNWTQIGHAVPDVSQIDPNLSWREMKAYGRGVWAGALRSHGGRYFIYFACPDSGLYVVTAPALAGPWSGLTCLLPAPGYDDPCPFWDDDGQAYLVLTRFAPNPETKAEYEIFLSRMASDGLSIDMESAVKIHQSQGSEANKLYKFNGLYYHYFSEVKPEGRVAMMKRAHSLSGPWQTHQLNHVDRYIDREPNQGGLVQDAEGKWWFLTHQGRGAWEGRALCLLPVTWQDGWPIIGTVEPDGIGTMVWEGRMPGGRSSPRLPDLSDQFSEKELSAVWEWNHQPDPLMWQIESGGGLRLLADRPAYSGFQGVRNVLSQRSWKTGQNAVKVALDTSEMVDGQVAGLCHFAERHAFIGVQIAGGERRVVFVSADGTHQGMALSKSRLWIHSQWDFDGRARFSYSLDGKSETVLGSGYQMDWGFYRGDRIGLFTYNELGRAGSATFRHFEYQISPQSKGVV